LRDFVSGELKVYTEMIDVKELLSKFQKTSNKNIGADGITPEQEPSNDTQKRKSTSLLM